MKTFNSWWFIKMTAPFAELIEGVPPELGPFDSRSESDWKRLFDRYFVPDFQSYDLRSRAEMKRVFQILLNQPRTKFEKYFGMRNPEVDPPTDVRQLFIWLWEVLFPGEDFQLADAADYVDVPDSRVADTGYKPD